METEQIQADFSNANTKKKMDDSEDHPDYRLQFSAWGPAIDTAQDSWHSKENFQSSLSALKEAKDRIQETTVATM